MEIDYLKLIATVLIPFALLFLGTLIAAIKYFLKKFAEDIKTQFTKLEENIEALEEKIHENDEKVTRVERDFMDFKADLPRSFVLRDDYIRFGGILEKRIDTVVRSVDSINTHVNELSAEIQIQGKDIKTLLNQLGDPNADRANQD